MYKKLLGVLVAVLLIPSSANAQTTELENSLIAYLTQAIELLVQQVAALQNQILLQQGQVELALSLSTPEVPHESVVAAQEEVKKEEERIASLPVPVFTQHPVLMSVERVPDSGLCNVSYLWETNIPTVSQFIVSVSDPRQRVGFSGDLLGSITEPTTKHTYSGQAHCNGWYGVKVRFEDGDWVTYRGGQVSVGGKEHCGAGIDCETHGNRGRKSSKPNRNILNR